MTDTPPKRGASSMPWQPRRPITGRPGRPGADDIDAVGGDLCGDLGGLAGEAEGAIGDVEIEILGHLVLVDDLTDREGDRGSDFVAWCECAMIPQNRTAGVSREACR